MANGALAPSRPVPAVVEPGCAYDCARMAQAQPSPRRPRSVRDLLLSLLPLVLIVLALAGLAGTCSFSPGGPTVAPRSVPSTDVAARLPQLAEQVPFAVRVPAVPPGWHGHVVDVDTAGSRQVVQASWLTPDGSYVRLSQSPAAEAELVRAETGQLAAALGPVRVAGEVWVRYPSRRDEQAWVADLGQVRVLITGSASPAEFRTLAAATLHGRVLR